MNIEYDDEENKANEELQDGNENLDGVQTDQESRPRCENSGEGVSSNKLGFDNKIYEFQYLNPKNRSINYHEFCRLSRIISLLNKMLLGLKKCYYFNSFFIQI